MTGSRGNSQVDERAVLQRLREDVQQLCRTSDSLLLPQYRHLLERVEALIEIAGSGPAAPDGSPASR